MHFHNYTINKSNIPNSAQKKYLFKSGEKKGVFTP
jgi:hypothetical protein